MTSQEDVDALGHRELTREAPSQLDRVPDPELQPAVGLAGLEQHRHLPARNGFLDVVECVLAAHSELFAELANGEARRCTCERGEQLPLKVQGPGVGPGQPVGAPAAGPRWTLPVGAKLPGWCRRCDRVIEDIIGE